MNDEQKTKWCNDLDRIKSEIEELYMNDDELEQSDHHDELHNWFSHVGLSLEEALEGLDEIAKVVERGRAIQEDEEDEEENEETVGRF